MKLRYFILGIGLFFSVGNLFSQTNRTGRLFIPFFDKESQSNVFVKVCNFGSGEPCPLKYTNTLSNTNLFTPEEQKLLNNVLAKYKNYQELKTNSGPPGSVLFSLCKTNYTVLNRKYENWVACFRYTNLDAKEEIHFGSSSISTRFLTKAGNGYVVGIGPIGGGLRLQFMQLKQGEPNGLYAVFVNSRLESYHHSFDRMTIGRYMMWNPLTGRLLLQAEFKEPYDLRKHILSVRWPIKHP
jgi:hypothetical protein